MNSHRFIRNINLLLPPLAILINGYISFTDAFIVHVDHSYLLTTLLFNFPCIFLLQGITTALIKSSIFLTLGLSISVFILTILLWQNSSATIFILAYLIVWLLGYSIVKFFKKGNSQP